MPRKPVALSLENSFDCSRRALSLVDRDCRFIRVNRRFADLLGFPPEKLIGRICHELVHHTPTCIEGCPFSRMMETRSGETLDFEDKVAGKWFRVAVDPIFGDDGEVAGALHAVTEVTESKRAEREAVRRANLMNLLHRIFTSAITETGFDGVPAMAAEGLCRIVGFPRCTILVFGDPASVTEHRVTGESPSAAGHYVQFRYPHDTTGSFRNRESVYLDDIRGCPSYAERKEDLDAMRIGSLLGVPLLSPEVPIGAVYLDFPSIHRWTPEEVQTVELVARTLSIVYRHFRTVREKGETSERLASLLNNVPGAVYRGLRDWSLQFFGAEIEVITGYSPEEFLSRKMDWRKVVHPEDLPIVKDRFRRASVVQEKVVRVAYRILHRDGSERWLEDRRQMMYDGDGRLSHVDGLLLDITDRRRGEDDLRKSSDMLRQSQKMEAVGRLAGGIAHDFNNLLTVIGGYSDLLAQRLVPKSKDRQDVEEIRNAATRASSLTRQLLAFSRKQVIAPTVADLNEVVAGTEKMLRRLIGEDIDLVTVLRPDLWNVRIDTGQIEQVLLNLAVNARDAMPGVGKLLIESENRRIDEMMTEMPDFIAPGEYAVLSVRDTGGGMDTETISHIFEPFFTTKEKGRGTGLGLATTYGIVKQSNGYITVESRPGEGSTFRLFFPRCDGRPDSDLTGEASSHVGRGKETLLLVEDDDMVRDFMRTALSSGGYTLLEAANGVEAVALLEGGTPRIDLVVTDVIMPKMGGMDLGDWLEANRPGVKVLFVSGYVDNELLLKEWSKRGEAYLQKPFTPDTLLRTLRNMFDPKHVE